MTAPVDVLAVMRRDHDHANAYREQHAVDGLLFSDCHEESEQARAAVEELLEADRYYDDAQFGLARARYNSEPLETWTKACAEADIRRAAALARCSGGAK